MMLANLTPHPITFRAADGAETTYYPAGTPARVASRTDVAPDLDGMPCQYTAFGPVEGLPAPSEGMAYIVSLIVLSRPECAGRLDVVAPATGPKDGAIRWAEGDCTDAGVPLPASQVGQVRAVTRWVRP